MNSKDLVRATLQGLPVPRVPVGPLAVHSCAALAGYNLQQYTSDSNALAESVIRYYERFQPDAIWVSADTWVSAQAMGAKVGAISEDQPFGGIGGPLIQSAADIDRIPTPDVNSQGRYPLMIKALGKIVQALGKDVFIVCCFDQYPFSLAAALMGINEIMMKVNDDPPFVEALMNRCAEYAHAYASALSKAGADMLSGGDSPAGLLGPQFYEDIALPIERSLIARIKASCPEKFVSLHICGDATPILPLMASTGASVLELDHAVDIGKACRVVGKEIGLWGNLDPVRVLFQGTPEAVRIESSKVLSAVAQADHKRFVLSSGCTLPVGTPPANITALIEAARASS